MNNRYKVFLHRVFKFTIIIKGIDGVLDIIVSAILLFFAPDSIAKIIPLLVRKELIEDPKDIIANYLLNISQHILPDTFWFIVVYLTLHGLIKIGLALALNSENHRAYKIAEIILITFIGYQFYRFSHTHSNVLLLFTLVDVIIVLLIHSESKRLSRSNTSLHTA